MFKKYCRAWKKVSTWPIWPVAPALFCSDVCKLQIAWGQKCMPRLHGDETTKWVVPRDHTCTFECERYLIWFAHVCIMTCETTWFAHVIWFWWGSGWVDKLRIWSASRWRRVWHIPLQSILSPAVDPSRWHWSLWFSRRRWASLW